MRTMPLGRVERMRHFELLSLRPCSLCLRFVSESDWPFIERAVWRGRVLRRGDEVEGA